VDTPGTGDVLWKFDQKIQEYLFQADVVVFVVSALSPLSESERAFLRISILPHDFPKVVFAINMLDKIGEEGDAASLTRFLEMRIARLTPSAVVFPLSAWDELCRMQALERPRPERASSLAHGFAAFRAHLEEAVLVNRETIQLDRAIHQARRMLDSFEAKVGLLKNSLAAEAEELRRAVARGEEGHADLAGRIEKRQAEARDRVRDLAAETRGWLGAFLDRLERETLDDLSGFSPEDLQRHFGFFLMNALCLAVERCLDAHRPALAAIANELQGAVVSDVQAALTPVPLKRELARTAAGFTFGDSPWSRLETFQFLAHSLQSRLAKLAAEILFSSDRFGKKRRQALSFQTRLRESLPALREELENQVGALYEDLAARLARQMEETSRQEAEASLAAVRRAQELGGAAESRRAGTGEALARALEAAGKAREALATLDRKLWEQQLVEAGGVAG
jgi:hypothetical protein